MKKIIVTGALGHIGSHLIRKLPDVYAGCEIVMIDNMMAERYCSLFNLPDNAKYTFIEGDVRKLDLAEIFSGADVVVHFAAITNAAASFDNAEDVNSNNYGCTEAVAKACVAKQVPMIFPSSTSVYGDQEGEVDESQAIDQLKPQSPYAESKIKEEQLIKDLVCDKGLKAVICRFGTIFGTSAGIRFHTAVNKFCWQAVMGTPLTVWSTAYDQYRPYLAVDDAVDAVHYIIENNMFDESIINVVSENYTVRDIVENIKKFVDDVEVNFVDHRIMNQLSYKVSNRKLIDRGYIISGDIEKGIRETIDLLKNSNQR